MTSNNVQSKLAHLSKKKDMKKTMLSRDTVVYTTKVNIEPKLGLYTGAIGTVVDIIFRKESNPNEGHLPAVVVVDLKHYRGPVWDDDNPTHAPIVPILMSFICAIVINHDITKVMGQ
jgi:hypothetical protein